MEIVIAYSYIINIRRRLLGYDADFSGGEENDKTVCIWLTRSLFLNVSKCKDLVLRKENNMETSTVMKKELHLVFTDTSKEEVSIVVGFPKEGVTKSEIDAVGQLMVEKDVLRGRKDQRLTSFQRGTLVTTESTVVA